MVFGIDSLGDWETEIGILMMLMATGTSVESLPSSLNPCGFDNVNAGLALILLPDRSAHGRRSGGRARCRVRTVGDTL